MRLVPDKQLALIDSHLAKLLDRSFAAGGASAGGTSMGELTAALRAYVLGGGKRVRPQLCLWTYTHCVSDGGAVGNDGDGDGAGGGEKAILDLACAWELFHAFLLAHDDIIDKGQTRRSQPSLHRRLASLDSGSEVFGVNLAIVGGDLLFTSSLQLLHELDLPSDRYREILRLFSRIAATTGLGQAIDIVQGHVPMDAVREAELLREYHWKTAAYTFEGPMVSGALAAGAAAGAREALSRFSLALGQAYQLQNDLIDLAAPAHEGCDIVQGKRTITLVRARAALSSAERTAFDERLARATLGGPAGVVEAEVLRTDLLARGAAERTGELVGSLLSEASAAAMNPALPQKLQGGLGQLLASLRSAYFA